MIGEWAKARAWGGNFLVNVGLDPRGELPATAYRRFAELKQWRDQLGFTLSRGLAPGSWPEKCNAPVLLDGSKWYVFLGFDWDELEVVVKEVGAPASVRLLVGNTSSELAWKILGGELRIPIRKSLRGVLPEIVEIDFDQS
jgi:alpha-L-fucosidase